VGASHSPFSLSSSRVFLACPRVQRCHILIANERFIGDVGGTLTVLAELPRIIRGTLLDEAYAVCTEWGRGQRLEAREGAERGTRKSELAERVLDVGRRVGCGRWPWCAWWGMDGR